MATIFNPNYLDQAQQVQKNKEDIEELKKINKPIYYTSSKLTSETTTITLSDTNIPEGETQGFLVDIDGNYFDIVTISDNTVYLKFWNNLKGPQGSMGATGPTGPQGVGIVTVENKGYTDGEDFTITHCEAVLSNGNKESFDVQAKHGKDGVSGGSPIIFEVPTGATNGTVTEQQLQQLQSNDNNYILLNNEKFYLMDKQSESGFLVYSHVGHDSTNNYFVKCITITISALTWVLNSLNLPTISGGEGVEIESTDDNEITITSEQAQKLLQSEKNFIIRIDEATTSEMIYVCTQVKINKNNEIRYYVAAYTDDDKLHNAILQVQPSTSTRVINFNSRTSGNNLYEHYISLGFRKNHSDTETTIKFSLFSKAPGQITNITTIQNLLFRQYGEDSTFSTIADASNYDSTKKLIVGVKALSKTSLNLILIDENNNLSVDSTSLSAMAALTISDTVIG